MKKFHSIKIAVKGGKVTCVPDPIHVKHNDEVEWICPRRTFTVYFGRKTPFAKDKFMAMGKTGHCEIRANATPVGYRLEFKYTVAVSTPKGILIADPTIIIDP